MKNIWKRLAFILLALFVIAAIAAFLNKDRLVRLYNVLGLFKQENIVHNFSHMDDLFAFVRVQRSGPEIDWPLSPASLPESFRFRGKDISITDFLEATGTTSLLVARNGAIAVENYYLGTTPEDRRISWSMAKSFLSALFGIAVAEGQIASLDDPVTRYVPELAGSAYAGASIRNVLNMASGVAFNEDYLDYDSDINRMGRVLALGQSMDSFAAGITGTIAPPGTRYQYVSIDTHVLSMVLRAATGTSLPRLFEEKLWSRLGVHADGFYLTDGYGVAFALGGLNLTTRDYARFGQMILQQGKWQDEQIVPAQWIRQSTTSSAPPPANTGDRFGYGYQWWVPQGDQGEMFAVGIYGQYIYINPATNVVIVKTSADTHFRDDGEQGNRIKHETIEMFRAISDSLGRPDSDTPQNG